MLSDIYKRDDLDDLDFCSTCGFMIPVDCETWDACLWCGAEFCCQACVDKHRCESGLEE